MIKRIFDFLLSLVGLVLLTPLMVFIAILISIKMPGPIFFRQKRVGQHGVLFTMIKFRTMMVDHGGSSISVKGESRITPLGAILRKYKLDELPELWNVFMGDMSFVGPRPDVPGYADKMQGEESNILLLKPGITGPASMKYSNEEEILALQSDPKSYNDTIIYPDKVRINLEYLKRRNIFMDFYFIILTVSGRKPNYHWI